MLGQTLPLFAASHQISTKKTAVPTTTKACGPSSSSSSCDSSQPLPQRQGPNPPPSGVGEPKSTDSYSQWYVSGPHYDSSNFHKCLQNKREPSVPVAFSISVLPRDRKSKAFSSCTVDPSNLRPIMASN